MMDYSSGNKRAWEYNAYEFWLKEEGPPSKKAEKIIENPAAMLKKYSAYFDTYEAERLPISAVPAERRRFLWLCWERK